MGGEALSNTLGNITLIFVISVVSFTIETYLDVSALVQAQKSVLECSYALGRTMPKEEGILRYKGPTRRA